jgi:chemotaxis protein CheX
MNVHRLIVEQIQRSAAEVFATMLGSELGPGEAALERGRPGVNDGVVSFIGLAGRWVGTGSISCSPAIACRLCSLLLMSQAEAVDEDVLDAVAELTNMIIGSVKNDLEPHLGPLGLSIPTVVFGRNFKTRSMATSEWSVVRFRWENEPVEIRLFLAPVESAAQPLHYSSQAETVDV